jgi:uncharacterized Ntn-hydrolase superfamily protein
MARMTWPILARDPGAGAIGVAVARRFLAVGALCPRAEGGVGALATQGLVNPICAIEGMARLRAGEAPGAIVAALTGADAGRAARHSTSWPETGAAPATSARPASAGPGTSRARMSPSPATCSPSRR